MKADGLILLGYGDYLAYRSKLDEMVEQGTHFVRWGAVLPDQPGVSIGCDNVHGGQLVGRHLHALGRRRVAFLGYASSHYPEFEARWRGCNEALTALGAPMDPNLQVDAETSEESGYAAAQELLARGAPFDAVFAASDLIAIGAMRALSEEGKHIPGDVAVVGFDDLPMARFSNPPLTTVLQDTARAGELLVDTLLRQIREEPVESTMLPASLVVRRSCGAV
jgi:DNA-binding LacI/PurR family transcriptional regulator